MTATGPQPDAPEVDIDTFAAAHAKGAAVLDVRERDEYAAAHVPGAVLIPLGELGPRLDEVPAGRPLYVICATGGRSLRAATALQNQVGMQAVNVAGGTKAWIQTGRPYDVGDPPVT
jgi:rhodanese-related sulfurtransferase